MWRRCAASEDAVEMIMAYHGAAPDGPTSPLATKTSCGPASLPEADETAGELGGGGGRGSAATLRTQLSGRRVVEIRSDVRCGLRVGGRVVAADVEATIVVNVRRVARA